MKKKLVKVVICLTLSFSIITGYALSRFINDDTTTLMGEPDKSNTEELEEWLQDEDNQALAKSYYMMTDWEDTELEKLLSAYTNGVITSNAEFDGDKDNLTKELALTYINNYLSTVNKQDDQGNISYPLISLMDLVGSDSYSSSITPISPYEDYTQILFTIDAFMYNNYDKDLSGDQGGYGKNDILNYKSFGIRNISFKQREYFDKEYLTELEDWLVTYDGDSQYSSDEFGSDKYANNIRLGLMAEQFWFLENLYVKSHMESDGFPISIYRNDDALQVVCEGMLLGAQYVIDNTYYDEKTAKAYYEEHKEYIDEYRINKDDLKNIESLGQYVKDNYFPAEIDNHEVTPFQYQEK